MTSTTVFAETQKSINAIFGKVKLVVNNQVVEQETLVYNGTTYVPLRATAEILDKEVTYDNKTSTAYIDELGTGRVITNTTPTTPTSNISNTNNMQEAADQLILILQTSKLLDEVLENEDLFISYFDDEQYDLAKKHLDITIEKTAELEKVNLSSVSVELNNALAKYVKASKGYLNNFNRALLYVEGGNYTKANQQLDEALILYKESEIYLDEFIEALEAYLE